MPDRERNRFSARAARYARVGANVGGVAARIAARALARAAAGSRRQCAGAGRRARRPEGPDHEGGAAAGHHSRRAAAGIRHRTDEAAEPGAADGLGLRQAPHERRARRRTGKSKFKSFEHQPAAAASLGQVHRAQRARRRSDSPASCNIPTCSRRSKPTCSQLQLLFAHPPAHGPGDRHHARSPRRSARACARNSTTRARPSTSRSISDMLDGRERRSACRVSGRSCRPAGC